MKRGTGNSPRNPSIPCQLLLLPHAAFHELIPSRSCKSRERSRPREVPELMRWIFLSGWILPMGKRKMFFIQHRTPTRPLLASRVLEPKVWGRRALCGTRHQSGISPQSREKLGSSVLLWAKIHGWNCEISQVGEGWVCIYRGGWRILELSSRSQSANRAGGCVF